MLVAASAGSFAVANEYARSGSNAMPVPIAMMPNPNQTQLTSGFTWISRIAVCDSTSGFARTR